MVRAFAITALALPLSLAACSEAVPLRLDAPTSSADLSMIAVFELPSAIEVHALDLAAGTRRSIVTAYDGSYAVDVVLLLYHTRLADLGLAEGRIALANPGEASRPLPREDARFVAHVLGDRAPPWMPLDALDPRVSAVRIPASSPCATFESIPLTLTSSGGGAFAVPLQGDAALVGTTGGGVFRVTRDGAVTALTVNPHVRLSGGYLMNSAVPQDSVLLGGDHGELWLGTVGSTSVELTPIGTSTSGGRLRHLGGEGAPPETVAFTLSGVGLFQMYDRGTWRTLWDFATDASEGDLAYVDRDEAVAGWPNSAFVVRYSGGRAEPESFSNGSPFGVRSLAYVAGVGTVVGTIDGKVFIHDGMRWREAIDSPFSVNVQSIAPYPGGFVIGGTGGNFAQYIGGAFCEIQRAAGASIEMMVDLGEDVLLVDGENTPDISRVTLFRGRR